MRAAPAAAAAADGAGSATRNGCGVGDAIHSRLGHACVCILGCGSSRRKLSARECCKAAERSCSPASHTSGRSHAATRRGRACHAETAAHSSVAAEPPPSRRRCHRTSQAEAPGAVWAFQRAHKVGAVSQDRSAAGTLEDKGSSCAKLMGRDRHGFWAVWQSEWGL